MSRVKLISVEALMKELGIDEWKHFKSLIKNNRLPQVSKNKPIQKKDADKISIALRGKALDWYRFSQSNRDMSFGGPLGRRNFEEVSGQVESWYSKIKDLGQKNTERVHPILGIVCDGGFLCGKNSPESPEFILPCQNGINIFVGDRGSGKSTALSMLGLLSNSSNKRSDDLIKAVFENRKNETSLSRRIWDALNRYGIEIYACYFKKNNQVYVFYVNILQEGYGILHRHSERWISYNDELETIFPTMQILWQGDVFRIADEEEDLVFNRILDNLYPDLYQKRLKLAHQIVGLSSLYKSRKSDIKKVRIQRREVDESLDYYSNRLQELQELDTGSERLVAQVLDEVESYIRDYEKVDIFFAQESIFEMLLQSGKDAVLCLYIGRINRALSDKISFLRNLIQYSHEDRDRENERLLLQDIFGFLNSRLATLYSIRRIFFNLTRWNEHIKEIVVAYQSFIRKEVELIEQQEKYCKKISSILKQTSLDVRLFTNRANLVLSQKDELIKEICKLEKNYELLIECDINTSRRELMQLADQYTKTIDSMISNLNDFNEYGTSLRSNKKYVFHPVRVELRQGVSYRSFERLSFGQKSGIILMIALWMTQADVVIIDQPEDNLDSQSIINMLAPTLLRVSEKRSVFIATHNSNLIMAIGRSNLSVFIMESRGDFGRLRLQGNLSNELVVRQMLDVLEGGVETFEQKWKLYEEFVDLFKSNIQDIDISLIERLYRRKTIDDLRNYLQPVVSDQFILTSFRHELRNEQNHQTRLQQELHSVQDEVNSKNGDSSGHVIVKLDSLLSKLDNHLSRVSKAIESIRRMDTYPHPIFFCLYTLLDSERKLFTKNHDIQFDIDENLLGTNVYADRDHIRLVFHNIFKNAIRATETKAVKYLEKDEDFPQIIRIRLIELDPLSVGILISDNGIGLSEECRKKIYIERYSDQSDDGEHGHGGIIIRKLLELNGGSIEVVDTKYDHMDGYTDQKAYLPLSP